MFSAWEDWDIASAAYFSFITLSTVGFGDLVPTKSFNAFEEGATYQDQMRMAGTIIYCSVGNQSRRFCFLFES